MFVKVKGHDPSATDQAQGSVLADDVAKWAAHKAQPLPMLVHLLHVSPLSHTHDTTS